MALMKSAPPVATQQPAIPDASTPAPAPDDLHSIVAKALKKDSGFTPIVYLKNINQYWVKIKTSDGQVLHLKIRYSLGKSKLQKQLQKGEDDELVAF